MHKQEEDCVFCGSDNLNLNPNLDIICEDCGKKQPLRCAYCGNESEIFDEAKGFICSKCGKPELEKIREIL